MRRIVLFVAVLLIALRANCQRPNYVPPSPQAFTFMKYGEYPVDYSTGLVDINIPFFSLGIKNFELPISARYHASGRKVDMNFSEMGLNWKLEAYGMITREIKGMSDLVSAREYGGMEQGRSYFESFSSDDRTTKTEKFKRRLMLMGEAPDQYPADAEYDIYNINFNGLASSFIIRQNGKVVFLNYFPYKVEYSNSNFYITDDKGIVYTFGTLTESGATYGSRTSYNGTAGIMSWFIGKVQTPQGEYMRFIYSASSLQNSDIVGNLSYGSKGRLGDLFYYFGGGGSGTDGAQLGLTLTNTISNENYRIVYLTRIESSRANVDFVYDLSNYSLSEIVMRSTSNTQVAKVQVNYKKVVNKIFSIPNNQGKGISEILVCGTAGSLPNKYTFDYYGGDAHGSSLIEYCYGKDFWGYANFNSSSNMIPIGQVEQYQPSLGYITIGDPNCRNSSYFQKVIGMLSKVTYPTGGSSEFEYEDNIYSYLGEYKSGPGIRIKKIKNNDGQKTYYKEYQYGEGSLLWSPQTSDFETSLLSSKIPSIGMYVDINNYGKLSLASRYRVRQYFSDPVGHIAIAYRQPVYYNRVTEFTKSESGEYTGKTEYTYLNPVFDMLSDSFSDTRSGRVTHYDSFVPHLYSKVLLQSKSFYSSIGNSFKLLKRQYFGYTKFRETIIPQLTYYRRHLVEGSNNYGSAERFVEVENPAYENDTDWRMPWNTIRLIDYNLVAACQKLESITEIDSIAPYEVLKNTKYVYGSTYTTEPSETTVTTSGGHTTKIKVLYPDDIQSAAIYGGSLAAAELAATQKLQSTGQHEVSTPIQIETYEGTVLKHLERNIYKDFLGKSLLSAGNFKTSVADAFVTDHEVISYDASRNPLEIRSKKGAVTAMVWSNTGINPIAIAENCSVADLAFTGFEQGDSGNWTWSGQVITGTIYSYDGESFLGLSSGQSISKSGLNASKQYRVSLWLYGVSSPPAGYTAVATKGDWTNFQKTISGLTTFTFTAAESVNGMVDNISICPVEAMMSTYSYKPLVGLSTRTDPRGFTEYYEYDGSGRLNLIKDFRGNILKDFRYHYKQ